MSHRFTAFLLVTAIALGAFSAATVPLRYDHGNSGRYLLGVLQAGDPELFVDDPVVDSLRRFRSLFYRALAGWAAWATVDPELLESVFGGLYWVSRILIVLSLMLIGKTIDRDPLHLLCLGIWGCFTVPVSVGGDSLFVNVVTHGTLGFLIGAAGLWALLENRRGWFWLLLTLGFFVHPLMAIHLLLCLGPAYLVLHKRLDRIHYLGGLAFTAGCVAYAASIPSFTPREAEIFVAAKAAISHVALTGQSTTGWIRQVFVVALALGAWLYQRKSRRSGRSDLLAAAIVSGVVVACTLSVLATSLQSARLVQLQPLRAFIWIQLFSYVLIIGAAVRLWRERHPAAAPLLLFYVLSLVPTLWQVLFAPIALAALFLQRWQRIWQVATWTLCAAIVGAWAVRDAWPEIETFRPPVVPGLVILGIAAYVCASAPRSRPRVEVAAGSLVVAGLLSALSWHRYYDGASYPSWGPAFTDRVHEDWDAIRRWFAATTPKDARVLVAGGQGNFRVLGLRQAVGEPMSALAWVDPLTYQRVSAQAEDVRSCFASSDPVGGCFGCLVELATQVHADYLLVEDRACREGAQPVQESGAYRVFVMPPAAMR